MLRNLLVDTGRQVGALDDLKNAFGKLVDPINKTLRALEQEKADNVGLRGTLADLRSSYETALARAEERITALGDQIKKLETDGEAARVKAELQSQEVSA